MTVASGFGGSSPPGFGRGQFGRADWTYAAIYRAIPEEYRLRDQNEDFVLRKLFDALGKSANPLILKTDRFPLLRSADDVDIELIDFLAQDFGIVTDQELSNQSRRSQVTHAVKWFILKGRKKSYVILGAIFGYLVTVENVYAESCDSTSLTNGDHKWLALYDEVPADVIPTDHAAEDSLDIYPFRMWPEHCPSHSLCLTIRRPFRTASINAFQTVLKIVDRLKTSVKPIHVDFHCLSYIEEFDVNWDIEVDLKLVVTLKNNLFVACYYDLIDADVMDTDQCLGATIQPICTYLNNIFVQWSCYYDVEKADVQVTDVGAICPFIIPVLPWAGSDLLFSEEFDALFP